MARNIIFPKTETCSVASPHYQSNPQRLLQDKAAQTAARTDIHFFARERSSMVFTEKGMEVHTWKCYLSTCMNGHTTEPTPAKADVQYQ